MGLLLESESVSKALQIATAAHSGQVDKAGADYIKHPIAVAEQLETEEEQTAALLHDVVEDTAVTLEDLKREGFSDGILHAVDCLTHKGGEPRDAYLQRVSENPLAVKVKLADLKHNSDLSRIPEPAEEDFKRTERYKKEIAFLQQAATPMKVRYIEESNPLSLLNGKVYDVLSIECGYYRIIDETGEDYLYDPDSFEIVEKGNPEIIEDDE